MERQGLLVELRRLHGSGGLLHAEADEVGGRDGLGAHGTGAAVDVLAIVEQRCLAAPVAMEVEGHLGPQDTAQAVGVAGAFLERVGRRVRVDADQPQDLTPRHRTTAEAAEVAGEEVGVAAAGHLPIIRFAVGGR